MKVCRIWCRRFFTRSGKEASDDAGQMTKVSLEDGTNVLLPSMPPIPTPFALQVIITKQAVPVHPQGCGVKATNAIYLERVARFPDVRHFSLS